ncbi:MAG: universal stress protein [Candidatus Omnitrophica bacterium]|nr:universal stress protein [Candidatus Omnitrophota bacterium]
MYKRILITLDNSSSDRTILTHVRCLAKQLNCELVLVHVAEGFAARYQNQLNLEDSEEIRKDGEYLKRCQDELLQEGLTVKVHLLKGEPADQILDIAQKESIDLIAMSTHGHKFPQDLILGSVAENIRHRTDIPILMIRANHEP